MAKSTRQTLKESFKQGKRPGEQDFENLIDSTMNILDDGFNKSPETGMGLAPLSDKGTVLSVFRKTSDSKPQWKIAIESKHGNLEIHNGNSQDDTPAIVLKTDGAIEFGGGGNSQFVFNGKISAPVREGVYSEKELFANGKWQDVTDDLDGCQALEVVAIAGKKNSGKHAVLLAFATNCFGRRGKIKKLRSNFGQQGYKICIRWKKSENDENKYKLQLRTWLHYGEEVKIRCHITSLLNENVLFG